MTDEVTGRDICVTADEVAAMQSGAQTLFAGTAVTGTHVEAAFHAQAGLVFASVTLPDGRRRTEQLRLIDLFDTWCHDIDRDMSS